MRISAVCFARIRDERGNYCLLLNKGRFTRGKGRILTPVGGALEGMPEGMAFLRQLGATDFESNLDLRFRIADAQVAMVVSWFKRRNDERECTVLHELRDELGHETGTLTENDMRGVRETFVKYHRYDAETQRDVPEKETAYLIEVFDVDMGSEATLKKLVAAASLPINERWVYFVSRREIERRRTDDGVAIGPISRYILQ